MISDSRWIVLLGLQDTKHIRLKIRRIQVDALEWGKHNDPVEVALKILELKGEDHEPV